MNEQGSVSFKKYKKLEKENIRLREQKKSLENELSFMKKNYIRKYRYHCIDLRMMFIIL